MNARKVLNGLLVVVMVLAALPLSGGAVMPVQAQRVQAPDAPNWEQVIVPRNYNFTWGSSGQNIAQYNTVYCSTNPDFTRVLYWRTFEIGCIY